MKVGKYDTNIKENQCFNFSLFIYMSRPISRAAGPTMTGISLEDDSSYKE